MEIQGLPSHWKFVEELPLNQTLEEHKSHRRLKVFYHKGSTCYICNSVTGTKIVKTIDIQGGVHLDVVSDENILLNVDHIWPKSKGGSNHLSNLAPCCVNCNNKKGANV